MKGCFINHISHVLLISIYNFSAFGILLGTWVMLLPLIEVDATLRNSISTGDGRVQQYCLPYKSYYVKHLEATGIL